MANVGAFGSSTEFLCPEVFEDLGDVLEFVELILLYERN